MVVEGTDSRVTATINKNIINSTFANCGKVDTVTIVRKVKLIIFG